MEKKYIEDFVNGNLFFSCCGEWISKARNSGGKGQGDKYEAVFAKYLRKNSRKPIQKYKSFFGKDLIIESEDDYIMLKRRSSLYIPASCFYSIDNHTVKNYLPESETEKITSLLNQLDNENQITVEKLPIILPQQYYDEFNIESEEIDAVLIQPREVIEKLHGIGAVCHKVTYINTDTEYDIFADELYKKDYGIEIQKALFQHIEIFYKNKKDYEHQCEFRVAFPDQYLSGIKKGLKKHLPDLSHISGIPQNGGTVNATGKDFISNVKMQETYAKAHISPNK